MFPLSILNAVGMKRVSVHPDSSSVLSNNLPLHHQLRKYADDTNLRRVRPLRPGQERFERLPAGRRLRFIRTKPWRQNSASLTRLSSQMKNRRRTLDHTLILFNRQKYQG